MLPSAPRVCVDQTREGSTAIAMSDLRSAIFHHIDEHLDEHIARIQEFLRQPSVSGGSKKEVFKCAELLRSYFQEFGCAETEIIETAGHPAVWAFLDAGASTTIANYCMYDTQPVDGDEPWLAPPFAAELIDQPLGQVVIARGAYNSKGPVRGWLNALQSISAIAKKPPMNIMFIAEGEEELGSPHLPEVIARYEPRLSQASALLEFEPSQDHNGQALLELGYKGNVYFELESSSTAWDRGASRDVHSMLRPILPSPLQHLVGALASFVEPDGNMPAIDGLAADIRIWPEDLELIRILAQNQYVVEELKRDNDVIDWQPGLADPEVLLKQYLYGPNININGIKGGFTDPGAKTIIPYHASSKLNIRLVPEQTPERVMELVRLHLNRHGYSDIVIRAPEGVEAEGRNYTGYTWSKTSINAPVVQAVLDVYRRNGVATTIWPHSAGSTPKYLFTQPPLSLPACAAGLGHGGRQHSTDEYLVIRSNASYGGLADFEKSCVDILYRLAEQLQVPSTVGSP